MRAVTNVNQALVVLQLVIAAMTGGVLVFAVLAALLVTSGSGATDADLAPILLGVLGAIAVVELPLYGVIRRVVISKAQQAWEQEPAQDDPTPRLLTQFGALTVVAGALAEGFGLLGCVAFLLTGSWPALVAPALGLLALFAFFPTRNRLSQFVYAVTRKYW